MYINSLIHKSRLIKIQTNVKIIFNYFAFSLLWSVAQFATTYYYLDRCLNISGRFTENIMRFSRSCLKFGNHNMTV